jgi:hypothetical protein
MARSPAIRNSTHPIDSGAQISRLMCCVPSPFRKEWIRLTPNARVPTKRTKMLPQSIVYGS